MFNEPSYEKIQGTKEGDVSLYPFSVRSLHC